MNIEKDNTSILWAFSQKWSVCWKMRNSESIAMSLSDQWACKVIVHIYFTMLHELHLNAVNFILSPVQ